jgi:3-oxoadipate enol-lactonase
VNVPGGRLFCEEAGEGSAVVLLHSSLVDRRMWDGQMEAFSHRYRAVRYDLRGFGRSDLPSEPFSHTEDLLALLDALRIERPALVGSSFGGGIALQLAAEHPSRLAALVLAAPGPRGYDWDDEEIGTVWEAMDAALEEGDVARAQDLELDLWVPERGHPADAFIRELARDNRNALLADDSLERRPDPPTVDRLSDVRAPTLVVTGERDLADIHAIARLIVERVPGAVAVRIPGADHLPNLRDPEAFDRAVLEFLSAVPGPW